MNARDSGEHASDQLQIACDKQPFIIIASFFLFFSLFVCCKQALDCYQSDDISICCTFLKEGDRFKQPVGVKEQGSDGVTH